MNPIGPTKPRTEIEPAKRCTMRWAVSHDAWAMEREVGGVFRVDDGSLAHAIAVFATAREKPGAEVTDQPVLTKSAQALRTEVERRMREAIRAELGEGLEVRFEWHPIQSSIGYVTAHGERPARHPSCAELAGDLGEPALRPQGRQVKARVGDTVKLRALFWDGPPPQAGDMLETATGRLYLIHSTSFEARRSSSSSFSITAIVLPRDCARPPGHRVFGWTWKSRRSSSRPARAGRPRLFGRRVS